MTSWREVELGGMAGMLRSLSEKEQPPRGTVMIWWFSGIERSRGLEQRESVRWWMRVRGSGGGGWLAGEMDMSGASGMGAVPGPVGMMAGMKMREPEVVACGVLEGRGEVVDWMDFDCSSSMEETWLKREEMAVLMPEGREESEFGATNEDGLRGYVVLSPSEAEDDSFIDSSGESSISMTMSSIVGSLTLVKFGSCGFKTVETMLLDRYIFSSFPRARLLIMWIRKISPSPEISSTCTGTSWIIPSRSPPTELIRMPSLTRWRLPGPWTMLGRAGNEMSNVGRPVIAALVPFQGTSPNGSVHG